MAKKRRKQEEAGGGESWLMTYGDMMTLLLTFFVLLLSFSEIEAQKFNSAMGSLRGALGITSTLASMTPTDQAIQFSPDNANGSTYIETDNQYIDEQVQELVQALDSMEIDDKVTLTPSDEGILIQIDTELLFETGEADIVDDFKPILVKIGELMALSKNLIIVEGHTDDRPIKTTKYPSNWELSGARASRIIRFFIDVSNIVPERFVMKGYAEFRPIADNESEKGRAKNRRVEILIKKNNEEAI